MLFYKLLSILSIYLSFLHVEVSATFLYHYLKPSQFPNKRMVAELSMNWRGVEDAETKGVALSGKRRKREEGEKVVVVVEVGD